MPLVVARGLRFHTQALGDGPPLVMLHGLLVGSLAAWYFTAAPALARSRRVLLFDLRGHGRSERAREGYGASSMARDLEALADGFDPRPLDLVGHSYGALVALRFALDHPARVRSLVLVEAPLPPSSFGDLTSRTPEELLASLPSPLAEGARRGGRAASRLVGSLSFLLQETTLLADLAAEPDVPDAHLARLACPVTCVYGARSACLATGERLARVVPGARLVVLDGGHFLHVDAPAALTAALVAHVEAARG
jgi:pimeloyl-ACP methyl ester carboxylesterase